MKKPVLITAALGLAVNESFQFLLTLRNDPKYPDVHNKWQIPGGGMEFGEQPLEALNREIGEELGVKVEKVLFPYPMVKSKVWNLPHKQVQVVLCCYLISIGNQTIVSDPIENLDYRWLSLDQLDQLPVLPLTKFFVQEAQQILTQYSLEYNESADTISTIR